MRWTRFPFITACLLLATVTYLLHAALQFGLASGAAVPGAAPDAIARRFFDGDFLHFVAAMVVLLLIFTMAGVIELWAVRRIANRRRGPRYTSRSEP